ncbi:Conserved_hypothetical protein [Hexamita inflata]|uniref:Uncharacterized protein n=1 Tax=Hexamita inflata TaxID=28002 RepID=A0AA86PLH5_9EUKA|nr:Conserved hypothetical protein [Hexamita inflata]
MLLEVYFIGFSVIALCHLFRHREQFRESKRFIPRFVYYISNIPLAYTIRPIWNVYIFCQVYVMLPSIQNFRVFTNDELREQLQKFYDTDFSFEFNFTKQSDVVLLRLSLIILFVSQILLFASHPGKASSVTCYSNDGMSTQCDHCNLQSKFTQHSKMYGHCISQYQFFDSEICNEIGQQNYLFALIQQLVHGVFLVLFDVLYLLSTVPLLSSLKQYVQANGFNSSLFANILSILLSKQYLVLSWMFSIMVIRTYTIVNSLVTNILLLNMGLTMSGFQNWKENIKQIARGQRVVVKFVEEVQVSEIREMKNLEVAKSVANHLVIKKIEGLLPGDIVDVQMSDRTIKATILTQKQAFDVVKNWKYGQGFFKELGKYIKASKFSLRV